MSDRDTNRGGGMEGGRVIDRGREAKKQVNGQKHKEQKKQEQGNEHAVVKKKQERRCLKKKIRTHFLRKK